METENVKERLRKYREFVYEKGGISNLIDKDTIEQERASNFEIKPSERFIYRTRYFTDSAIIGSKEFVKKYYHKFKSFFTSKEKNPKVIKGLKGIYSLKLL